MSTLTPEQEKAVAELRLITLRSVCAGPAEAVIALLDQAHSNQLQREVQPKACQDALAAEKALRERVQRELFALNASAQMCVGAAGVGDFSELCGWIDATKARLLASTRALEWQPISTASKTGEPLMLWWRYCQIPAIGCWVEDETGTGRTGWKCDTDDCVPKNQEDCTHWLYLPAYPKLAAKPLRERMQQRITELRQAEAMGMQGSGTRERNGQFMSTLTPEQEKAVFDFYTALGASFRFWNTSEVVERFKVVVSLLDQAHSNQLQREVQLKAALDELAAERALRGRMQQERDRLRDALRAIDGATYGVASGIGATVGRIAREALQPKETK